jgi:hypothetical protein
MSGLVFREDVTGMLVSSSLTKKIHPYSLRSFVNLIDQPIYKKHADVLAREKVLSLELMMTETQLIADLINAQSMTLSGAKIVASTAQCE